MSVYLPNDPELEIQKLQATIMVLSIALACATQPSGQAMMRAAWRKIRPPISEEELDALAATWELEPDKAR